MATEDRHCAHCHKAIDMQVRRPHCASPACNWCWACWMKRTAECEAATKKERA